MSGGFGPPGLVAERRAPVGAKGLGYRVGAVSSRADPPRSAGPSAAEREERGYNIVAFDDGVSIARRGIETRITEMRRASFRMAYEVHKADGTHVLSAWMEFLFLKGAGNPVRVPGPFATAFASEA